jgi:TolB-like protein/DNA-binding winged helix-turn-helix (wHTH) protein/Flp pilus assembly protein TadD
MDTPAHERLRFSRFEVDVQAKELRRAGKVVKLPPQALRLLEFLARHPRELVTREEIRQELWSRDTFVDFEHSINKSIRQIRDALGDDAEQPTFIETVRRRGYRFIAELASVESAAANAVPGETASLPSRNDGASAPTPDACQMAEPAAAQGPRELNRRHMRVAATLAILAAILTTALNVSGWRDRLPGRSAVKSMNSLAVLPLQNLSRDPEQDYFADGMTDELITTLGKISALRVISRTSIMQYKATKKPVAQIARELNVDGVLEGTVTHDKGRVRITVQLIHAAPERHLWAEQYEGDLSEVLTMQDAVAKAVADEIQIKLTPRERTLLSPRNAIDPAAYEAYLRGRRLWEFKGELNLERSEGYFEEAIKKDPSYAQAWAGLADTYNYLANWGAVARQDVVPRVRAAARRALELDNSLVTPLVALADVKAQYEWDWVGAEQLCKQAIELNPNYGEAHHVYATFLAALGRTKEAIAEARRAHEIEPLNLEYAVDVPWKLYLGRRYEEAELESRKLKEWWPSFNGSYPLASIYLQTGRTQDAIALLRQSAGESHRGALELMYLGHTLGVSGARSEGRKVLEEMQRLSERRYIPPEYIAVVYEGLGERDRALQWFEKAYREHSMNVWILPDPALDSIRFDARFEDVMKRMGLPR